MTKRERLKTLHKIRMRQRRMDQWNRKRGWIKAADYTNYHGEQRQRLAHFIEQL